MSIRVCVCVCRYADLCLLQLGKVESNGVRLGESVPLFKISSTVLLC